jgi:GT2 family glycosyltransferase
VTHWPRITVAVLSHRRPHLLRRVIGAVAQLDYPDFEIVVIGDRPTIGDHGLSPGMARHIRYHCLEEANVARARNLAIALAGGEIVAFCDDDSAPEPDWLRALAVPFRQPCVAAASGTVLGADGLRVEWQGCRFDHAAREWPDPPPDGAAVRITDAASQTSTGRYAGLIGVNSAFRRSAVLGSGGFDEAYRYFLEETDLAIRLARAGWSAALAPGAVVHHLREQNDVRTARGVPRSLYQIAASKAHFCRRHMPAHLVEAELARYRAARMARLDPHIRLGALRAGGLRRLERQLDRGLAEGLAREPVLPLSPADAPGAFAAFRRAAGEPVLRIALLSGGGLGPVRRIRPLARCLAAAGHPVSCFTFVPGPQRLRVTFSDGVWQHRGGTWRLDRRPAALAAAEMARVAAHRNFDVIIRPGAHTDDAARLHVPGQPAPLSVSPARPGATLAPETMPLLERALAGIPDRENAPFLPLEIRRNAPAGPLLKYS